MLLRNAIESLNETPLKIQNAFTEISEIQQHTAKHEATIQQFMHATQENEAIDDKINYAFSKLYESDKLVVSKYDDVLNFLDDQIDYFERETEDFRENCAISALKLRSVGTELDFDDANAKDSFCYCKNAGDGSMVACDGEECKIEWFHYKCVGLTEQPKGKWLCDECKSK